MAKGLKPANITTPLHSPRNQNNRFPRTPDTTVNRSKQNRTTRDHSQTYQSQQRRQPPSTNNAAAAKKASPPKPPAVNNSMGVTASSERAAAGPKTSSGIEASVLDLLADVPAGSHKNVEVSFSLDWQPWEWYAEQEIPDPLHQVLPEALVYTGTGNRVQATSVEGYLKQVWPETGRLVLKHLTGAFERKHKVGCYDEVFGKPNRAGAFIVSEDSTKKRMVVTVKGCSPEVMSEVADQMAWLAGATRYCPRLTGATRDRPFGTGGAFVRPAIRCRKDEESGKRWCDVNFVETKADHEALIKAAGGCWREAVLETVVVEGYPIPERGGKKGGDDGHDDQGLEVPLEAIALLTDCDKVATARGVTYILGRRVDKMLVATKVVDKNIIFWHYQPLEELWAQDQEPTEDLTWEQYEAKMLGKGLMFGNLKDLTNKRHIIGWTNTIESRLGAPDVDYLAIDLPGYSENFRVAPRSNNLDSLMFRIGVSIGVVSLGAATRLRPNKKSKQVSEHSQKAFKDKLERQKRNFFILFDTDENRGWLVDGVCVSLHLLQTYIATNFHGNPELAEESRQDAAAASTWGLGPTTGLVPMLSLVGRRNAQEQMKFRSLSSRDRRLYKLTGLEWARKDWEINQELKTPVERLTEAQKAMRARIRLADETEAEKRIPKVTLDEELIRHQGSGLNFCTSVLLNEEIRQLILATGQLTVDHKKERSHRDDDTLEENVNRRTQTTVTVEERLFEILDFLADMKETLNDRLLVDGLSFRNRGRLNILAPRNKMEGFRFLDVIFPPDQPDRYEFTMDDKGVGWVDWSRRVGATPLFGTGFGDLLFPSGRVPKYGNAGMPVPRPCCAATAPLPKSQNFLGVAGQTMTTLIRLKSGSFEQQPWVVSHSEHKTFRLITLEPEEVFKECECGGPATASASSAAAPPLASSSSAAAAQATASPAETRVQLLISDIYLNVSFLKIHGDKIQRNPALQPGADHKLALPKHSALILGHTMTLPLHVRKILDKVPLLLGEDGQPLSLMQKVTGLLQSRKRNMRRSEATEMTSAPAPAPAAAAREFGTRPGTSGTANSRNTVSGDVPATRPPTLAPAPAPGAANFRLSPAAQAAGDAARAREQQRLTSTARPGNGSTRSATASRPATPASVRSVSGPTPAATVGATQQPISSGPVTRTNSNATVSSRQGDRSSKPPHPPAATAPSANSGGARRSTSSTRPGTSNSHQSHSTVGGDTRTTTGSGPAAVAARGTKQPTTTPVSAPNNAAVVSGGQGPGNNPRGTSGVKTAPNSAQSTRPETPQQLLIRATTHKTSPK